jgi:hypothetical protein
LSPTTNVSKLVERLSTHFEVYNIPFIAQGVLLVAFCFTVTILYSFPAYQQHFDGMSDHCAKSSPISASEFLHRQTDLADTLRLLGASAYIAEPGASAQFYGNISESHWSLSDRPVLLIITPSFGTEGASPNLSILTPKVIV